MSILKSNQAHVIYRAECHEAQRFLRTVKPALLALTECGGIVCREERHGDTLYDVRAQVTPEVAGAIYGLITDRGVGREDVTVEMVVAFLNEKGMQWQ